MEHTILSTCWPLFYISLSREKYKVTLKRKLANVPVLSIGIIKIINIYNINYVRS